MSEPTYDHDLALDNLYADFQEQLEKGDETACNMLIEYVAHFAGEDIANEMRIELEEAQKSNVSCGYDQVIANR